MQHKGLGPPRLLAAILTIDTQTIRGADLHHRCATAKLLTKAMQTGDRIFEQAQAARSTLPAPYALAATPTRSSNATRFKHGTASTPRSLSESTNPWYSAMAAPSAATSNGSQAAQVPNTTLAIYALDACSPIMELKLALARRSQRALTPYKPDAWEDLLHTTGLWPKYSHLPQSMRGGFNLEIPLISITQTPPNKDSIIEFAEEFQKIVLKETSKGRYLGPFLRKTLEALIGPFQSSPFGIIPKPG